MPQLIGLDFETYSATDLEKHGLDRYINDPDFTPLIASAVGGGSSGYRFERFDFVHDMAGSRRRLGQIANDCAFVAQNAGFEEAVLDWLGIKPTHRVLDSAVVARAAGAGSKLEAAAPQLLGIDKLDEGRRLIKLFSVPGKYQEKHGTRAFHTDVIDEHLNDWDLFAKYCDIDAKLGLNIVEDYGGWVISSEHVFAEITRKMGRRGWPVDIDTVKEMQRRYLENQEIQLEQFRQQHNAADLNLNSLKQLKEWCAARGVKATSFDKAHVERLLKRIDKKLATMALEDPKTNGYCQVRDLLHTKQVLGGSSLKKLQTILDTVGEDGRLRDQYLHCGAGQTLRTTGRSVQMQNLKRIGGEPADMDELEDDEVEWDNTKLAANLRQVFTASHPDGQLLVGDFSSVESRGLGWIAEADWKVTAFRQGKDLYKVLATKIFPGLAYDAVTKPQRQTGKVGELSCGYGAGPGAVQSFASGMGVELSEGEATKLVGDWRAANPEVVELWKALDDMLHAVVEREELRASHTFQGTWQVQLRQVAMPISLVRQHPKGAVSVMLRVLDDQGEVFLMRIFHGCYMRGRNVGYYRASERKTGDLWRNHFTDPKTKQTRFYEIYGGKLAGILTQSFCRELFFRTLRRVEEWTEMFPNIEVIGQFHDEIVLDWWPTPYAGGITLKQAKADFERIMSDPGIVVGFPLAAEIKSDYRYTK